jgi:polyisoprenoid-binding protein YceI
MEEHLNENYMDSEKFPRAIFKGKIVGFTTAAYSKPGKYDVTVEGDLTIRDVTQKVTAKGTLEIAEGVINASSKFNISPEDYKIEIPGVVREKIAKNLETTVTMKYTPVETK